MSFRDHHEDFIAETAVTSDEVFGQKKGGFFLFMPELTNSKSLRRVYTDKHEFVWLASENMANHMEFSSSKVMNFLQ